MFLKDYIESIVIYVCMYSERKIWQNIFNQNQTYTFKT